MSTDLSTLGGRIRHALVAYGARHGSKTHEQLGQEIALKEGRSEPYSPDEVFSWMDGSSTPSLSAIRSIAGLSGLGDRQVGWLAYGDEWPIHGLNEADYNRVHRRSR